jgi:hypothetical protein
MLDKIFTNLYELSWLRHSTFQRIFGRTEEARGAGPSLEPPPGAISGSNWRPESDEVRSLFKAPREDGFPVPRGTGLQVMQFNKLIAM